MEVVLSLPRYFLRLANRLIIRIMRAQAGSPQRKGSPRMPILRLTGEGSRSSLHAEGQIYSCLWICMFGIGWVIYYDLRPELA
jgi:hypothetical protein